MTPTFKKGLVIAVMLHLSVFVLLVAGYFLYAKKEPVKKHVFHLAQVPSTEKKKAQAKAVVQKKVEEKVVTKAKPKPKTVAKAKPKPKKVAPKPEPPKKISYAEFVKKQGEPKPLKKSKRRKSLAKATQPVSQLSDIKVNFNDSKITASAPDLSKWAEYTGRLRERIDEFWDEPEKYSNYKKAARIIFTIEGNGSLSDIRIKESSGSAAFDESIKNAFKRIVNFEAPPTKRTQQFEMSFSHKMAI